MPRAAQLSGPSFSSLSSESLPLLLLLAPLRGTRNEASLLPLLRLVTDCSRPSSDRSS